MKIELLKEFIKKTVKQEVRSVIQEELKVQLNELLSKQTTHSKQKTSESDLEQQIIKELETMNESVSVEEPKPTKKYVKYSNNPLLNDILNQTSGGIPQEGGLVSMMGGYDSGGKQVIAETKAPENAPEPVKTVYNAMNRDYRALLKAVDKKKK